jgi:polysaccharide chain length determinant protein (PEP-CTERM system associated)
VASFADERIKQIQQKVMTIDNINKIITKFKLYPEDREQLSNSELALNFTENTILELVSADVISKGRKSKATLAFTLSFDHKNAEMSQKIANELVTLFLDENARSRTEQAKGTATFLAEETEKFKLEIQKIENQIADYKDKYSQSLPEGLSANLSSIDRIKGDLQQLSLKEQMLNERKAGLRTQIAMTNPLAATAAGDVQEVLPDSLPTLQAKYSRLLNRYSKSHPDVKRLKRKIENFEQSGNSSSKKATPSITNPVYLQLQSEMRLADVEISNIQKLRIKLAESISKIERNVSQTNQVERGYNDLMRDLDNHKDKYRELKAKYLDAKLALTLEEEQKAEKFSLLEPPRVPDKPEKPNRIKIIFMGFALSIGGGLGMGYLMELMDNSIRGHKTVLNITGEEPLVVIPYLVNDEDLARTQRNKINFAIIALIIFLILVIATHFLYMGLDLIWYKLLYRIGTALP